MRRNWLFIVLGMLLTAASGSLIYHTLDMQGPAFYISEGVMILCLIMLYVFYVRLVRPLDTISGNIDSLYKNDLSSRLKPVGQHEADRIVFMFNDMMARLKDEELHLREQNHFLDLLIDTSPMGIVILGMGDRIVRANPAAVRFLGEAPGKCLAGRRLEDMGSALSEALLALPAGKGETVRLGDSKIYHCSRLTFMDKGVAHPFLLIDHLTHEVVKAEKRAYEKVIRMMSHEVNNSMGGVASILDSIKMTSDNVEHREALDVCLARCRTMSSFITSFADMVKIPEAVTVLTDLNVFVGDSLSLLESMCAGCGIRLVFRPSERPVEVMLDQVLMDQVLINLVKNAVESIGHDGEVVISVEASPCGFIVADNGAGIDRTTQGKLFTPFFSTKADGRGLGLLFVSDVLHKHHCEFSLRTDPDGLTRFSVVFPVKG